MRITKNALLCLAFMWLGVASGAADADAPSNPAGNWRTLARCAAAYRANSEILDAARPPSMAGMIADQSNDYEAAAEFAYQRSLRASAAGAHRVVGAYVTQQTPAFSKLPRAKVEQFIESCPQLST
jgi:hypothetical protein